MDRLPFNYKDRRRKSEAKKSALEDAHEKVKESIVKEIHAQKINTMAKLTEYANSRLKNSRKWYEIQCNMYYREILYNDDSSLFKSAIRENEPVMIPTSNIAKMREVYHAVIDEIIAVRKKNIQSMKFSSIEEAKIELDGLKYINDGLQKNNNTLQEKAKEHKDRLKEYMIRYRLIKEAKYSLFEKNNTLIKKSGKLENDLKKKNREILVRNRLTDSTSKVAEITQYLTDYSQDIAEIKPFPVYQTFAALFDTFANTYHKFSTDEIEAVLASPETLENFLANFNKDSHSLRESFENLKGFIEKRVQEAKKRLESAITHASQLAQITNRFLDNQYTERKLTDEYLLYTKPFQDALKEAREALKIASPTAHDLSTTLDRLRTASIPVVEYISGTEKQISKFLEQLLSSKKRLTGSMISKDKQWLLFIDVPSHLRAENLQREQGIDPGLLYESEYQQGMMTAIQNWIIPAKKGRTSVRTYEDYKRLHSDVTSDLPNREDMRQNNGLMPESDYAIYSLPELPQDESTLNLHQRYAALQQLYNMSIKNSKSENIPLLRPWPLGLSHQEPAEIVSQLPKGIALETSYIPLGTEGIHVAPLYKPSEVNEYITTILDRYHQGRAKPNQSAYDRLLAITRTVQELHTMQPMFGGTTQLHEIMLLNIWLQEEGFGLTILPNGIDVFNGAKTEKLLMKEVLEGMFLLDEKVSSEISQELLARIENWCKRGPKDLDINKPLEIKLPQTANTLINNPIATDIVSRRRYAYLCGDNFQKLDMNERLRKAHQFAAYEISQRRDALYSKLQEKAPAFFGKFPREEMWRLFSDGRYQGDEPKIAFVEEPFFEAGVMRAVDAMLDGLHTEELSPLYIEFLHDLCTEGALIDSRGKIKSQSLMTTGYKKENLNVRFEFFYQEGAEYLDKINVTEAGARELQKKFMNLDPRYSDESHPVADALAEDPIACETVRIKRLKREECMMIVDKICKKYYKEIKESGDNEDKKLALCRIG